MTAVFGLSFFCVINGHVRQNSEELSQNFHGHGFYIYKHSSHLEEGVYMPIGIKS